MYITELKYGIGTCCFCKSYAVHFYHNTYIFKFCTKCNKLYAFEVGKYTDKYNLQLNTAKIYSGEYILNIFRNRKFI